MPKKRREFRRFDDLKGLNDAPEPFFRARSDFEGPGARKPPKSTKNHKNNLKNQQKITNTFQKDTQQMQKKSTKNFKQIY